MARRNRSTAEIFRFHVEDSLTRCEQEDVRVEYSTDSRRESLRIE